MKIWIFACVLALLPTATRADSMKRIEAALKAIPSAAHGTAWNAFKACHIKIDRKFSELTNTYGDPKNQLLHIIAAVPPPSPDDARYYKELLLRWQIKNGIAVPLSAWAIDIQTKPVISPALGC
ncbi:hypothetical protein [Chromobacterium violaceum]|uniref:hypothetical protein n=1 Tax=Chromobacterium violaceum TaxID=536 RepID=UPI0019522AFE|nr:hypothetical protein [Chromobacterium violaceum]QRO34000.1 hypothetical protein I6K04_04450 [Chromobacterium violaceum]QRQ16197.1 hypothetical protein I6K03_18280 [Chromobacterium violaceum]